MVLQRRVIIDGWFACKLRFVNIITGVTLKFSNYLLNIKFQSIPLYLGGLVFEHKYQMNITEQKILSGMKIFLAKTKNVGRTKLFKLLFFWDFINFKRFGKTVTEYEYHTYPFGPVPEKLYKQMIHDELPELIKDNLFIEEVEDGDITPLAVKGIEGRRLMYSD